MIYKKAGLLVIGIIGIFGYFATPFYNDWLFLRILNPHLSIQYQAQHLDTNERKELRYGNTYILCMQLVSIIQKSRVQDPLILLPPKKYLQALGIGGFDIEDPPMFYYFTGLRSVLASSPGVEQATLAIVPDNQNKLVIKRIHNKEEMDRLLSLYKPYTGL